MPPLLAQQRMTLSDLDWRFYAFRAVFAVAELLVYILSCCNKIYKILLYNVLGDTSVREQYCVYIIYIILLRRTIRKELRFDSKPNCNDPHAAAEDAGDTWVYAALILPCLLPLRLL